MGPLTNLLFPLMLAGWSPQAQAEIAGARTAKLGHHAPFATASAEGARRGPKEVMSFYAYWDAPHGVPAGKRAFAVRRARWDQHPTRIQWAWSKDCPALEPLLVRMEEIETPKVDAPGVGREGDLTVVADGTAFRLWSRLPAWSDGNGYELEMSSNHGTPLANWVEAAQHRLDGCWRDEPPSTG